MIDAMDMSGLTLRECNNRIRSAIDGRREAIVTGVSHLSGVAGGLGTGSVKIRGDAGDYLGILNHGADIDVLGNAGRFLGDGMTGGSIHVHGDAGEGAAEYCYSGTVVIDGSAGDFLATMNKGATVIVGGDVGDDAGTYMVAGDILILGMAGERLGNYIIRGTIYINGSHGKLGNNTKIEKLRSEDIDKLGALLKLIGSDLNPRSLKKIVPMSQKPFYKKEELK